MRRIMKKRSITLFVAVALVAGACGGGDDGDAADDRVTDFVEQDSGNLDLDEVTTTTEGGDSGGAGASEGDGSPTFDETSDTVPTGDEGDEFGVGGLFGALSTFSSCLEVEGYQFIGPPDPDGEPTDPVNDPGYGEALGRCAATSNIQQAFRDFQNASENLTTEQIETRNRTLVFWIDCMEGRGWVIGEPSVDANGLQQPTDLTPPDGESIMGSDDLEECAGVAQEEYEASLEDGES